MQLSTLVYFKLQVPYEGPLILVILLTLFQGFTGMALGKGTPDFLGGLSLHVNHLIASRAANYDWPFGTLPFGLFGSNLEHKGP